MVIVNRFLFLTSIVLCESSPGFTNESSPGFTNESSPGFTNCIVLSPVHVLQMSPVQVLQVQSSPGFTTCQYSVLIGQKMQLTGQNLHNEHA